MIFQTLSMRDVPPPHPANRAYLERNGWNDYGYYTLWQMYYVDEDSRHHTVGSVKIASYDLDRDERSHAPLAERFETLPDGYFSLGQDASYYETLTALGDSIRDDILRALNDLALDLDAFEHAYDQDVTQRSLLRYVTASEVRRQFHRLASGGAKLSPYSFTYHTPSMWKDGTDVESVGLSFHVEPESKPPTNVHVLIGRNGVGKSVMLNNIANALARDPDDPTNGWFDFSLENSDTSANERFANLVSVAFSAFDEFEPLRRTPSREGVIKYSYIGLKKVSSKSEPTTGPKDSRLLAAEFGRSVRECLFGARLGRWRRALEMLESDPIFADAQVAELAGTSHQSDEEIREAARLRFGQLSSGHKIVLLTITRLVETVEEASLVLLDEPESHLHPPLLAAFVRALSDLLENRNGVAIIATHSPVILQEVPRSCVWKLRRVSRQLAVERPMLETYGENVGILTQEVFSLEVSASGFHKTLSDAVHRGGTYDEIVGSFDAQLGGEARALIQAMIFSRDSPVY